MMAVRLARGATRTRNLAPSRRVANRNRCGHRQAERSPNSAVPMRTRVEPSSMAISKSPDMPMESSRKSRLGCWRARSSRSERKRRKQPRADLRIVVERSNGHQTAHGEGLQDPAADRARERNSAASGSRPVLAGSVAELDFEQKGQLLPQLVRRIVEAVGEAQGVDAVDPSEDLRGAGGLVRLQMPDEVNFAACDAEFVQTIALRLRIPARDSRRRE